MLTSDLRRMILGKFTNESFDILAFECFPDVQREFSGGMTYSFKIIMVLQHVETKKLHGQLLECILDRNSSIPRDVIERLVNQQPQLNAVEKEKSLVRITFDPDIGELPPAVLETIQGMIAGAMSIRKDYVKLETGAENMDGETTVTEWEIPISQKTLLLMLPELNNELEKYGCKMELKTQGAFWPGGRKLIAALLLVLLAILAGGVYFATLPPSDGGRELPPLILTAIFATDLPPLGTPPASGETPEVERPPQAQAETPPANEGAEGESAPRNIRGGQDGWGFIELLPPATSEGSTPPLLLTSVHTTNTPPANEIGADATRPPEAINGTPPVKIEIHNDGLYIYWAGSASDFVAIEVEGVLSAWWVPVDDAPYILRYIPAGRYHFWIHYLEGVEGGIYEISKTEGGIFELNTSAGTPPATKRPPQNSTPTPPANGETPEPTQLPAPTEDAQPPDSPLPPNPEPAPEPDPAVVVIAGIDPVGCGGQCGHKDEWIDILNSGGQEIDIGGFSITSADRGFIFTFPPYMLKPGEVCRVWSDFSGGHSCEFSLGRSPWWRNKGDTASLYDAGGNLIDSIEYTR